MPVSQQGLSQSKLVSYVLKSPVLSPLHTLNLAHFPGVDGSEIAMVRALWSDDQGEFGFVLALP